MNTPTIELPWSVAVLTFKYQISSALLLKGGRTPTQVLVHVNAHTNKPCPEIEEIMNDLIEQRIA